MTLADLLFLTLAAVVFLPLESFWPASRNGREVSSLRVDILHMLIGGQLIRWAAASGLTVIGLMGAALVPHPLRQAISVQPLALAVAEVLLLSDLGFYWAHRLFHAVPLFWRFHQVHHSSERLDWIAAHRVHPVDQVVNSLIIASPAILLGFPPQALFIYSLAYRCHALLLHSNIKLDFGPFRQIVASPHFHHWHHAEQPDAYDRNFGGQLVIFDRLFGTANLRRREFPTRYGLAQPISGSFIGQLAHPFTTIAPVVPRAAQEPA